ncbi:unnamed protein product, partial [Ectocarpus sp. 13 AM-2016]
PLTKARVTVSSGRVQFYSSSINITPQVGAAEGPVRFLLLPSTLP